jgi:hypothetical protein
MRDRTGIMAQSPEKFSPTRGDIRLACGHGKQRPSAEIVE